MSAETNEGITRLDLVLSRRSLCVCLVLLPAIGCAQIAFIKRNSLYVLPCDKTGKPAVGAKPVRVCALWPILGDDSISIQWVTASQIGILHDVEAENGPKRFGLSQEGPASGIWFVDAKRNAKPERLTSGFDMSFSPDGTKLLFDTDSYIGDLWQMDLKTKEKKLLERDATQAVWSNSGGAIAFIKGTHSGDFSRPVEVKSYPAWKLVRTLPASANPCDLSFSPDGAKVAVHYHLSRPLTGHTIFNLRHGTESVFKAPDRYAPPLIDDWSPDGGWIACSWRIEDPGNDGSWKQEFVGLFPVGGGPSHSMGTGREARFAQDGRHLLWLTDPKGAPFGHIHDLVWSATTGAHRQVLVRRIKEFAVYRRP